MGTLSALKRGEAESIGEAERDGRAAKLQKIGSVDAGTEKDAPPDSPAHQKVHWQGSNGCCWFEIEQSSGERVRMQTTVGAAGGCRETAMRIARLCYVLVEGGADKKQAVQFRDEQYRKLAARSNKDVRCLFRSGSGGGGAAPLASSPSSNVLGEEDAPADSPAHHKVKWQPEKGTFCFVVDRGNGEAVRLQTTVGAAGGCRETAARIARLCYAFIEGGASRDEALRFRAEQYQKATKQSTRALGLKGFCDMFRKFHGEDAVESPCADDQSPSPNSTGESGQCDATPPRESSTVKPIPSGSMLQSQKLGVQAKQAKQGAELFRNLRGEVVAVNANSCNQKAIVKPWAELEPSDVDMLSGDDVYFYEKELNLSCRRSLEERIARLEQMAQRTTLRTNSKVSEGALDEALAGIAERASQEDGRGFDAQFLQIFLALPASERRHASASEVSCLERVARVQDGYNFTMSERRARLKERLWLQRSASASKASGFLQAWAKPATGKTAAS